MNQKLTDKKIKLEKLLKMVDKELASLPGGRLRISMCRGRASFYKIDKAMDTNGKYIRKKDHFLAQQLAQRDYCEKMHKEIIREIKAINSFLANCPENGLASVYENLGEERKKLITPYELSTDEYVKKWLSEPFKGKGFSEYDTSEFITKRGERVRSKSELLIANTLYEHNIPYKYECPVNFPGANPIYVDFTILIVKERREKYIEHFGMMDNPDYLKEFFWKNSIYTRNGLILGDNLYMLFESKNNPLNTRDLEIMISNIEKMG